MRFAFALFVVAFTAAIIALKVRNAANPPAKPTPAALAPPRTSSELLPPKDDSFIGVVLAGDSVKIEPEATGRIAQIFVKPGDEVVRGAPIAQLDVHAVKSELMVARASAAEAARRLTRRARLVSGGIAAITPEELDNARFDAAREQAKAASLARAVSEARVVAPFDGTVTELYAGLGAMTGPGRPIVRLLGKGAPRVRFAVPEEKAAMVRSGMPVSIDVPGNGPRSRGTVLSITGEVDNASGMVYAMATINVSSDSDAQFTKSGLVVRVLPQPDWVMGRNDELERKDESR